MAINVEGTITINGEKSHFSMSDGESWHQWGATEERLWLSVDLLKQLDEAFNNYLADNPQDSEEDEDGTRD